MMNRLLVVAVGLAALLASAPAFAQQGPEAPSGEASEGGEPSAAEEEGDDEEGDEDVEATVEGEAEEEESFPVSGSVSVGGSFGAASILSNSEFTQTDYFSSYVGLGLGYKINDTFSLSSGISYSKFLTEDGSVFQREGRLSDTSLGIGIKGYTDEEYTGISINPSVGFSFPTSDFSITSGKIMSVRGGLSFSRSFGGLRLSYSFGASKNWHKFTSVVLEADELDVIARDGGVENVGADLVAIGGVLTSFSISNSFSLGFSFLDGFSAGLSLSYSDSFTYDNGTITQEDEFTAENAVAGRGHGQGVSGGLRLGYRILPWLSSSVSANTGGQPLTNDQKSLRFPFWDFENGISSRTSFSLGLSASY